MLIGIWRKNSRKKKNLNHIEEDTEKKKNRKVYKGFILIVSMENKTYLLLGIPLLAFTLIFAYSSFLISDSSNSISNGITREGIVYYSTTGDFEGRISEPHVGIMESVGSNGFHNLLTVAGQNATIAILGENVDYGAWDYIALCNASAGCTDPDADDVVLDNEAVDSGLARASGTYAFLSDGYYSIYHTFTATADDQTVNMTGLFNQSTVANSLMLAENSFTLVTLQTDDQLLTNWTVNVTDGS